MSVHTDLIRPDDLLNLHVEGVNLRLSKVSLNGEPKTPSWVVDDAELPAQLIFTFPSQTISEQAFFESDVVRADPEDKINPTSGKTTDDVLKPPGQVPGRMGGPSRLVFNVPANACIPFTSHGLLNWINLELSVNPIAAIPPNPSADIIAKAPRIAEPKRNETTLELPYRLIISPNRTVSWVHRLEPFTHAGRTELWHTRLALPRTPTKEDPREFAELSIENPAPLRAIWSPDYGTYRNKQTINDPNLGLTAMSPNDRHQIVVLSSAFHDYEVKRNPSLQMTGPHSYRDLGINIALQQLFLSRYRPYVPEPFYAQQLMLSPLGSWLKLRGAWPEPPRRSTNLLAIPRKHFILDDLLRFDKLNDVLQPHVFGEHKDLEVITNPGNKLLDLAKVKLEDEQLDLSEWTHVATQGRDHYVRIVYEGVLYPFGHRAALIKVTERKFKNVNGTSGVVVAYLIQRMFIVVREPEKRFTADNRGMPLKRVRLTTLITPDIAKPQYVVANPDAANDVTKNLRAFWVEVNTGAIPARFAFHAESEDGHGNIANFTAPIMFVSISALNKASHAKAVSNYYNLSTTQSMLDARSIHMDGAKLAYAERDRENQEDKSENTEFVTDSLNFIVELSNDNGPLPKLMKADVKIPSVQQILGNGEATTIKYYADYLANGFTSSNGVFAEIAKFDPELFDKDDPLAGMASNTLNIVFGADQAGGFATPDMAVSTLTRKLGPLAGKASDAASDTFNPTEYFPLGGLSKLLGTFDLAELLPFNVPTGKNAPQFTVRKEVVSPNELRITAALDWVPAVKNVDLIVAAFEKDQRGKTTKLEIHGKIEKSVKLSNLDVPPTNDWVSEFTGTLNDFNIVIVRSVVLQFVSFTFVSRTGSKVNISVELDKDEPLIFTGPLSFVKEIRNIIPPGLFGKDTGVYVTENGIRAGFSIALPPIAVGVFALKDVSFGAWLTLPFVNGKPSFDFNISERPHPFVLQIGFFGGGGFFRLQLDTAGMKALEISFEFGATASIDLGLASGGVFIMAGIYFSLQRKDDDNSMVATLTGFLRMGGYLSVLGLIKISIEFNLCFTYKDHGKAFGRATLTVQVEIAFFSKSVELTVERQFGGSSNDPAFAQMIESDGMWSEYASAFA